MRYFHKGIRRFCSIILGLVFFGAGLLKLIDPVGAGLVVDEYFKFFHVGFLSFASELVGLGMAMLETLTGAALLAGVWRKWVALLTSLLTVGFTILTLILVVFNPQMDCGCFGEAIHLTHIQTFVKNLILCALCAVAFLPFRDFTPTRKAKVVAFATVSALCFALAGYSLVSLPLVDFGDFAPGTSLVAEEDAHQAPATTYTLIYEKDGTQQAFTLEDLPDSTWTFVKVEEQGQAVSDEGPLMYISDKDGRYADELLGEGRVLILSIYDKGRFKHIEEAEDFLEEARGLGFTAFALSREYIPELESYTSDFKKVITLNRSNGGVTYLADGEVVRKWPARSVPSSDELKALADNDPDEVLVESTSGRRIAFEGIFIFSLTLLLIL